jgi:DNA-binding CsgD family transcriptional regulator
MSEQPRAELLTDSQKTCLRLVSTGMSSKEIAIQIGLTPRTVDQYVNLAAQKLGASTRREAARILVSQELEELNKLQLQPAAVEHEENSGTVDVQTETQGAQRHWLSPGRWLPPIGGNHHDLDQAGTVYAILRVSVVTVAAAGLILAIFYWLNRITL